MKDGKCTATGNWYQVKPMGEGLSLISETYVADWVRCNIWHIQGRNGDLLIDTGMGAKPLKSEIARLRDRPVTCISTHAHFDHIGGAHEFDCRLGHRSEQHIHAAPDQANTGGWDDFVRAETFSALPHGEYDIASYTVTPAPLTGFLDEGDIVDTGDRVFEVFHLPGHSPGSIALYERKTKTLFSGDTIYDGALYDTVYHSDKQLYRQSLERLKALPVAVVHAGHDQSFGKQRLDELIDLYFAGGNTINDAAAWVSRQIG